MNEIGIAIIIVGRRNFGKTTTIKFFEEEYDEAERKKSQCRVGWRQIKLFLGKLDAISCLIYFIPTSPSESNIPLEKRLKKLQNLPEMLIIAEQSNGKEYNATKDFLKRNNYKIIEFPIDRDNAGDTWQSWTDNTKEIIMKKRAIAIGNAFREYIIQTIT